MVAVVDKLLQRENENEKNQMYEDIKTKTRGEKKRLPFFKRTKYFRALLLFFPP